jgi:hypothetical protein
MRRLISMRKIDATPFLFDHFAPGTPAPVGPSEFETAIRDQMRRVSISAPVRNVRIFEMRLHRHVRH